VLTGDRKDLWRYRGGQIRIGDAIENNRPVGLVVTVSHRPRGLSGSGKMAAHLSRRPQSAKVGVQAHNRTLHRDCGFAPPNSVLGDLSEPPADIG